MEKAHNKQGIIYCLKDPISMEIRYIGKTIQTTKRRLQEHIRDCRKYSHYNACWINGLVVKGYKPLIEVVELCNSNNLNEREIHWIKYYRQFYKLTNLTDGGDGNNGQIQTELSNLRRSKTLKEGILNGRIIYDNNRRLAISKALTGKIVSQETRDKLRACNVGKKQSEEVIYKRTKNQGRAVIVNDISYKTMRIAATTLSINEHKIWRKCNGINVQNFPYKCSYIIEDIVESV